MKLYPFVLVPRLVPKLWGGRRLESVLGKPLPGVEPFGESWEVFDFPPGIVGPDARRPDDAPGDWTSSPIENGPLAGLTLHRLMRAEREALLGRAAAAQSTHGEQFPLLIKFLDARADLSVQVHPPPRYVQAHADAFLKNECWTVLAAEPGARLLIGTKPGVTREQFAAALREGTCESLLNSIPARVGETHYLPSGTVHALGGGILAAEVQTPSDTTFRVFDFGRVDPATGRPRVLHVEEALECIDFENDWRDGYTPAGEDDRVVARTPQFVVTRRVRAPRGEQRYDPGEMRVLICIEGAATLEHGGELVALPRGQVVLLPASVAALVKAVERVAWLEATANPSQRA